jgi:hypothetical protein
VSRSFRREMLVAYMFPVGLFLVLPYALVAAIDGFGQLFRALVFLPVLVAPIAVVGYVLAPWAGRNVATSKAPAFIMGALAAVAPSVVAASAILLQGAWGYGFIVVAAWAFFAVPASVLGSLLFIGACERSLSSQEVQ